MCNPLKALTVVLLLGCLFAASTTRAQALVDKRFPSFSATVESVDSSEYFHFRVTWNDGTVVSFQIWGVTYPEGANRIEMRAYGTERLYLFDSKWNHFFIVNPRTGALLDEIYTGAAEISPDFRFLAFTNPISYGNPDDSTAYLVYDMALSPADNRMGPAAVGVTGLLGPFNSGWAIYPAENRTEHSIPGTPANSESRHEERSPFSWLDSRTIAFVDYSNGVTTVVLAHIGSVAHQFQVQERVIEPTAVLDYSRVELGIPPAAYLRVEWIEMAPILERPTLRLSFPGQDSHFRVWSLDIPF